MSRASARAAAPGAAASECAPISSQREEEREDGPSCLRDPDVHVNRSVGAPITVQDMPGRLSEETLLDVVRLQNEIVASGLSLEQAMDVVARRAMEIARADAAVVELVEDGAMVYRATAGTAAGHEGTRMAIEGSLSGRCVLEERVLTCEDALTDERVNQEIVQKVGARSMICVPLMNVGSAVGVLKVYAGRVAAFGPSDAVVLDVLSGTIAAHMANAERFERAVFDSTHDALTGLSNRRAFDDRLEREVRRAVRYGSELSLIVFDLDGFKLVNDRYGHDAGDAALRDFAGVLTGGRGGDECFRIGGDEFAVLLPETSAAGATVVAERIAAATGEKGVGKGRITASYGIAEFAAGPAEDLHRAADLALGAAKRARTAPRLSVA